MNKYYSRLTDILVILEKLTDEVEDILNEMIDDNKKREL